MIRAADTNLWCDYCKDQWGKLGKNWHPMAMTKAYLTVTSQAPKSKGIKRSYCQGHIDEISNWPKGDLFTLYAQVTSMEVANV